MARKMTGLIEYGQYLKVSDFSSCMKNHFNKKYSVVMIVQQYSMLSCLHESCEGSLDKVAKVLLKSAQSLSLFQAQLKS